MAALILLLRSACSYYVPLSLVGELKMHEAANLAIKASDHAMASTLLKTAADHGTSTRSHLLLALHEQHIGSLPGGRFIAPENFARARLALSDGLRLDPTDATLLQVRLSLPPATRPRPRQSPPDYVVPPYTPAHLRFPGVGPARIETGHAASPTTTAGSDMHPTGLRQP